MKTTKAQLAAEYQSKLNWLEKEETIALAFPESLRDGLLICEHSNFVTVKVWSGFRTNKTTADALPIIQLFKDSIVQGEHWKGGSVSTWPESINSNAKRESAVMDGSHEIEVSVQGGRGFGPDVEISFWANIGKTLVEISIPVCDLHVLVPHVSASYNQSGLVSRCDIRWPAMRSEFDSFRTFWSEKPGFSGSYYFAESECFFNWIENKRNIQTN